MLIGFGVFKYRKRAARTGKNPKTGEGIKIAATVVPKFTAGAGLKVAEATKGKKKYMQDFLKLRLIPLISAVRL